METKDAALLIKNNKNKRCKHLTYNNLQNADLKKIVKPQIQIALEAIWFRGFYKLYMDLKEFK